MTRIRMRSAAAAIAAFLLTSLPAPPLLAQVTARLEGIVTDDAGTPMEGVEVFLKDASTNAVLRPAKTSKKGRYLYVTQPGSYIVYPQKEGYMVVRQVIEVTNADGVKNSNTSFFDDKQNFDKPIRLSPTGDVTSKAHNKVDFVLTTPDKLTSTVSRLNAEYRGGTPAEEGEGEAAAPAAPAPPETNPYEVALGLIAQKDYAGATPILKGLLEKEPANADAWYQLGKAGVEMEDLAEAEIALKKAKEIDATKPGVSFHLAVLYNKKGRKVQAVQALQEELALTPDNEAVLDNLATLYLETGQTDKAIQTYEDLIARNPEHFDAYLALANLYKDAGDRAKEEDVYKRMGDRDPTGQSLYNLGNLAFNRDERDKASVYYQRVLEKNPNHAMAHYQLANTLVGLGDFPGAVSHFEAFMKLSPKDPKFAETKRMVDDLKKLMPAGSKKG